MTQHVQPPPITRTQWLPRTRLGWWCVALGGLPLVLFGLLMFVFPLVGMLLMPFGLEEINIGFLDTWITPVAMAALMLAGALIGIVAHRRGERSVASELTMWLGLAAGAVLAVPLIAGAFGGA